MSRELFAQDPSLKLGTQKWYTVPLSILAHVVIIGAVVVIPLMATDVLPTPPGMMSFVAEPPPPPPPPPPPRQADVPPPAAPRSNPDAAPIEAPDTIAPEAPIVRGDPAETGLLGGADIGIAPGVIEPPPPPPAPTAPVRPGGQIRAPQRIRNVEPLYPSIAQAARVQGVVIIEATIGTDGRVQDAKVLRSIPLLDGAAREAVLQWQYTPTLLNGVPVPVIMTVTVNFQLR